MGWLPLQDHVRSVISVLQFLFLVIQQVFHLPADAVRALPNGYKPLPRLCHDVQGHHRGAGRGGLLLSPDAALLWFCQRLPRHPRLLGVVSLLVHLFHCCGVAVLQHTVHCRFT